MELNRNNIKKIMLIIAFAVLFYLGVQNFDVFKGVLMYIAGLFMPLIIGACIAFILCVPLRVIENRLLTPILKDGKLKKMKRPLGIVISILFIGGAIFFVMFLIIPEVANTVAVLSKSLPEFVRRMQNDINKFIQEFEFAGMYLSDVNINWKDIGQNIFGFISKAGKGMFFSTIGIATSIVGGAIQFFLAFVFAIYILMQKEKFTRQAKQFLYAYLPYNAAEKIVSISTLANRTFSKFLSGQCFEAVILGVMFFFTLTILKFPYALLIGVLIGFTALIPVVGSFVGCIIAAFLILTVSPVIKVVYFLIIFLILQQIEGNLIYPRVVGGSVGLPSIWVLAAVTVGGSAFGIVGILLFIPLVSVVYAVTKESIYARLDKREIPEEKWKGKTKKCPK